MYVDDLYFEEVFSQYDQMIYHVIHKLNINDRDGEFYQIGLTALYEAYRKYWERDTFSKLAYITIKSRLIDEIRRRSRVMEKEVIFERIEGDLPTQPDFHNFDPYFWNTVKESLTDKQWTYVQKRFIEDKPFKVIAEEEQTTIDAVKGWGKEVKRKLKTVLKEYNE